MRAIPDPFKKLGEKNFTRRAGQPDSFSPPTFFMLPPPLARAFILVVVKRLELVGVRSCALQSCGSSFQHLY